MSTLRSRRSETSGVLNDTSGSLPAFPSLDTSFDAEPAAIGDAQGVPRSAVGALLHAPARREGVR